jgi:hypothetical protein
MSDGSKLCGVETCGRPILARGWCGSHLYRLKTHGDVRAHIPIRPAVVEIVDGRKDCTYCGVNKPLSDYTKSSKTTSGYNTICKECRNARRKASYAADSVAISRAQRWKTIKHRFNLTRSEYEAKLEEQSGVCAICGGEQPGGKYLAVDHDHNCCSENKCCGECNRGLLCNNCNTMLGHAKDDIDRLLEAVAYLRRWSQSQ